MKKQVVFISMVFVLLAALVAPATVTAAGPKTQTEFTAVGFVYVSGEYMHHEIYPGNGGYIDVAVHEPIEGQIVSSTDWDAIDGAFFTSSSTGVAKAVPDEAGGISLVGSIVGSFTLITETGTLSGHMWADVDAPLVFDEAGNIIGISEITDIGTFKINSGTGSFKRTKASGTLGAALSPVFDPVTGELLTYAGGITLAGQYR